MSASAFAGGWHIEGGELGVDIDVDTTTYVSGNSSWVFKSGSATTARLVTEWVLISDIGTGGTETADNTFEAYVVARFGTSTPSHYMDMYVETTDASRTAVNQRQTRVFGTGGWNTFGFARFTPPSGDVWARIAIERPVSVASTLHIDTAYFNPSPSGMLADFLSSATPISGSFNASNWTDINLSSAASLTENWSTLSTVTTLYKPGLYHMHGQVRVDSSLADGDKLGLRIQVGTPNSSGTGIVTAYIEATSLSIRNAYTPTSGKELALSASGLVYIEPRRGSSTPYNSTARLQQFQYVGSGATYTHASLRIARISGE